MSIKLLEKTVTVPLSPAEAFTLFTKDIQRWWPAHKHSISAHNAGAPTSIKVDPHKGGKIQETRTDGSVENWATITDWTPEHLLSFDWFAGRDENQATSVSVTFTQDPSGTRVNLTHDLVPVRHSENQNTRPKCQLAA